MTDYYVLGSGRTVQGPFTLAEAREHAAHEADLNDPHTVHILAESETVKGVLDDEMRPGYEHYLERGEPA